MFCLYLNREINVCDLNPVHHLFAAGTIEVGVVLDLESFIAFICSRFGIFISDCVAVYRGKWNAGTHVCALELAS